MDTRLTTPRLASAAVLPKSTPVSVTPIAVAIGAFLSALALLVWRPLLVQKLAIPVVTWLLHPGRMVSPEGVEAIEGFFYVMAGMAGLVGGLTLGYALLWRYFSERLPREAVPLPRSMVSSISTVEICCVLTIFALAFLLRIHGITRGLSFDEITTAMYFVDTDSLLQIISTDHIFNNHIANSILAHFSQTLFGRSEWALRLPAFLLGLTSLYCLWFFARSTLGPLVAIVSMCSLAISPAHVFWSESCRGYAGMVLFTLISNWFYYKLFHRHSLVDSLLFVLSSTIAIYFHLFSAFVAISQATFLFYIANRQASSKNHDIILNLQSLCHIYISLIFVVALSLTGYSLVLQQNLSNLNTIGHGSFKALFVLDVIKRLSDGAELSNNAWWLFVVAVFCIALLGARSLYDLHPKIASYFVWLFILPFLVLLPARPYYLDDRFLLYLLPYYILLLALGFLTLWRLATKLPGRLEPVGLRALCVGLGLAVLSIWSVHAWSAVPQEGYREVASALEINATPSTGVCAVGFGSSRLRYYAKKEIFIAQNCEQFEDFLRTHAEIRCADMRHNSPLEPRHYREIAEFLAHNAEPQSVSGFIIYTYRQ
jgi:hypothetical protein